MANREYSVGGTLNLDWSLVVEAESEDDAKAKAESLISSPVFGAMVSQHSTNVSVDYADAEDN